MSQVASFASWRVAAAVIAIVTSAHAAVWHYSARITAAPDITGQLASVSYAPYVPGTRPDSGVPVTEDIIRADLKLLAPYTRAIRTYSSTGGVELVPAVANEFGLKVTVGIWIDNDDEYERGSDGKVLLERNGEPKRTERAKKAHQRNELEIKNALELAKKHRNVIGIVVGNETIYRADKTLPKLIELIRRVKRESPVPVTTGEIWSVWAGHGAKEDGATKKGAATSQQAEESEQELASVVDYVAAHILPYWERVPAEAAVDQAINQYEELRRRYPGKRIVIAEFGWPSAGYNRGAAEPDRIKQAQVLRDFIARADARAIDYNIIEALDQPWKTFEGSVGAYWGLFDASRQAKFPLTGPLFNPDHLKLGAIAVFVGLLMCVPILTLGGATVGQALLLSMAAHAVGAWSATVYAYWDGHYFVPGSAFALGLGCVLLIPLVLIALSRLHEISELAFGRGPRRLLRASDVPSNYAPKVSIHIPAYREQPEMLKQTLDSVAQLNYPNFECVVIINNTPDPAYWMPIEEHCRVLGDRFKFINAQKVEGFKAGALRLALTQTSDDTEIIGVIDADYVVHPDWLKDLVPAFADPEVGLVQAPQDHRDGARSLMHRAMNGEYAGFFDGGMVQRNETNAIIVHGTMCLIRRTALASAGGWSSDTICEDTDLGLAILELGWQAHYTNVRYGHGLLPDTLEAFKKQRHRWAYGGVQIVKKHWRRFLPGASRLTTTQKREFTIGWINWLGAESIGVVVAMLNLAWVPVVAFLGIAVPDKVLTLPIVAAFAVSLLHFIAVYRLRVAIPARDLIGACFAAMSVQWTVARAVSDGVIKDHLPFNVTAKGGAARKGKTFPARSEAIMGGLLVLGAAVLVVTNYENVREINLFALAISVQSLPFLSAVAIALLEGRRINDPLFWRGLGERMTGLLSRRPTIASSQTPVANSAEQVQ